MTDLEFAQHVARRAARDAYSALEQRDKLYRLLTRVVAAHEAPTLREFEELFDPLVDEIRETLMEQEIVRVAPEDACPCCGERRRDWLVWSEYVDVVTCTSCGHEYGPQAQP